MEKIATKPVRAKRAEQAAAAKSEQAAKNGELSTKASTRDFTKAKVLHLLPFADGSAQPETDEN